MSVLRVIETGARGSEIENDRTLWTKKEYTREFTVTTSSLSDEENAVLNASTIPKVGQVIGNGSGATCYSVTADRDGANAKVWRVVASYRHREQKDPENKIPDKIQEKINSPPGIRSGLRKSNIPIYYARGAHATQGGNPISSTVTGGNNTKITNSVGDEFAERPTMERGTLYVEVTRFEAHGDVISAARYDNVINADTFWNCEPGLVRLSDVQSQQMYYQTDTEFYPYWQTRYTFEFRRDGWYKVLVDEGVNEISDLIHRSISGAITSVEKDKGKKAILRPNTTVPVSHPVHLNGMGHPLDDRTKDPVHLHFQVYNTINFSWLNMPQLRIVL